MSSADSECGKVDCTAETLRRINTLLLEAYREALVLDETFQD